MSIFNFSAINNPVCEFFSFFFNPLGQARQKEQKIKVSIVVRNKLLLSGYRIADLFVIAYFFDQL